MFHARDLVPCSNYTLHIVPKFGDLHFEAFSAKASTHLGDCQEDLLEDDISSTTQTTQDIQRHQDTRTKSSSSLSHVIFLSKPIMALSGIFLCCALKCIWHDATFASLFKGKKVFFPSPSQIQENFQINVSTLETRHHISIIWFFHPHVVHINTSSQEDFGISWKIAL